LSPLEQLKEIFVTMDPAKEGEFILPDSFFINFDNPYEFIHWKLREKSMIWDIESFCRAAEEVGFRVLACDREFKEDSAHPQTSKVVLGKPEWKMRASVRAAKEFYKDRPIKIVEVGVNRGDHAEYILKFWGEGIEKLYLLDAWKPCHDFPSEWDRNKTRDKVINKFYGNDKVEIIIDDSATGARRFEDESVDFVYIDADHLYEPVKRDIFAWLPKIKKGGIIGGHDYDYTIGTVRKAVDDIFNSRVCHGQNCTLEDWWVFL
jgi:hypothetical protein